MKYLVGSVLLVFSIFSGTFGECIKDYCLPGLACWPSPVLIELLKAQTAGQVLQPFDPDYNEAVKMDNPRLTTSPGIVVMAENNRDVQQAVIFAGKHNIRITVMHSRQDQTGKSAAHGSLQINLSKMQSSRIELVDARHPDGVMYAQAGNTWSKLYEEADSAERVIVGDSKSAGTIGGFIENGGYGPLSRSLGLAADNLLEFDMVTSDGSVVRSSAAITEGQFFNGTRFRVEGSDIFWAIRGGGSNTFGIVTNYLLKLHKPPDSMVSLFCAYPFITVQGTETATTVLSAFLNFLPSLPSEWTGYVRTSKSDPSVLVGTKSMMFAVMLHYGPWGSPSRAEVEPLLSELRGRQFSCLYTNISSFLDWQRNFTSDLYSRHYMTSTFLQYDSLRPEVVNLIVDSSNGTLSPVSDAELACAISLLGGKIGNVPADYTPISAAYRTALATIMCYTSWEDVSQDNLNSESILKLGRSMRQYTKGVYLNEPDAALTTWKDDYWGNHYQRLLKTKAGWDSNNVFFCRHCIGSDTLGVQGCNTTVTPPVTIPAEESQIGGSGGVTVDRQPSDFTGQKFCSRFCSPGHTCWPTRMEINALAVSLEGELLTPNMKGYSELIIMKDTLYTKHPGIVVLPLTNSDVQKAIAFAKKYNIRLSVLSSGHDYNGKSTADGSLQINFSKMKGLKVNLDDKKSPSGSSIYAETGNVWWSVYREVDKYGKIIVGGSAQTVAMGGYTMGGGHSIYSRVLGLAVDNVVEFQIVLADGTLANASANGTVFIDLDGSVGRSPSTDLFWAVLGGGGGTFGVVTSFTYQIHTPPSQFVSWNCLYPVNEGSGIIGRNVSNFFLELLPKLSPKWGGYFLYSAIDPLKYNGTFGTITFSFLHYGGWDEPSRLDILPLHNFMKDKQVYASFANHSSYLDYKKNSTDPLYFRIYTFNTLVQNDTNTSALTETILAGFVTPSAADFGCTGTLLGGKVSEVPNGATSVGKHLRSTLSSLTCGLAWIDPNSDPINIAVGKSLGENLHKQGKGVYYNEPDINLPTWKADFWGENYERLLSIKQQWDRHNFFYCHHCVGSDLVDNFSCNRSVPVLSRNLPPVTGSCSNYESLFMGKTPMITPLDQGVGFCSRYCLLGNPCWPYDSDLAEFTKSISGSVLVQSTEDFGTDFPNGTTYNYPGIIVKANTATDVQKALLFATDNNLEIATVSPRPRDVTKSGAASSLQIDLSNMTFISVNLNDRSSPTGSSITVESGNSWTTVYREANRYGKVVVGASNPTVHIDDFTGNGGFGLLSRTLGLSADNVLGFRIVLPDGHIADASKERATYYAPNGTSISSTDGDLFWAVKGGGADTFGIVTDITFILHDAPSGFVHLVGIWRLNNGADRSVGEKMLEEFHRVLPQLSSSWGGELLSIAQLPQDGLNGTIAVSLLHFGNESATTAEDLALINSIARDGQILFQMNKYGTFWDYHQTVQDETSKDSYEYEFNTLIQYDSDPKQVADFIMNVTLDFGKCAETLIGGRVSQAPADRTAVNPTLRKAIASLTCSFTWADPANTEKVLARAKKYGQYIREIGEGSYASSAEPNLTDWQTEIWGQHYDRLLEVKEKYDPWFLLNCETCIGYDLVKQFYNETYDTLTTTTTRSMVNYTRPTLGTVDFVENNEFVSRYCLPGLACWPSDAEFIALEASLDGNIVQPFDNEYVTDTRLKNNLRSRSPGLVLFPRSVSDIQRAVLFARDNNLRISIVSSRHGFNGKNTADGSLQINLSQMKRIFMDAVDKRSPTTESVTVDAGVLWGEIYEQVNRWSRRVVVGPSSPGVSVGGYVMGGGFSPVSPSLGLAADNTIAFQMVTADGRIVNSTKTETTITDIKGNVTTVPETELFWAVRGGGGGTFGIVTSVTFQLHVAPVQFVQFDCVYEMSVNPRESLQETVNFFHAIMATLPRQWGGKFLVSKTLGRDGEDVGFASINLLHYGPRDAPSLKSIEPFFSFRREWQTVCRLTTKVSFLEYLRGVSDLPYDRIYNANGIFTSEKATPKLTNTIIDELFSPNGVQHAKTCFYDILGGKVNDPGHHPDAINPSMRKAAFSLTCAVSWSDSRNDVSNIAAGVQLNNAMYNHTDGVYMNYASYFLPNWKNDIWGNKYNALLDVKRDWDPEHFFYCRHCVGSEAVENFREQTRSVSRPSDSPNTQGVQPATNSKPTNSASRVVSSLLFTLFLTFITYL